MNPRLMRRITFGYMIDCFPGPLIIGCNQMKRKVERAGFAVAVSMEPLTELPPDTDMLFVPAELLETAKQFAPQAALIGLEDFMNQPIYNELIEKLVAGQEWTAAQAPICSTDSNEAQIITYQGYKRIG